MKEILMMTNRLWVSMFEDERRETKSSAMIEQSWKEEQLLLMDTIGFYCMMMIWMEKACLWLMYAALLLLLCSVEIRYI